MTCEASNGSGDTSVGWERPVGYWVNLLGDPPWTTEDAEAVGDRFRGELSDELRRDPVRAVQRAVDELVMAPDAWPLVQLTRDLGRIFAERVQSPEMRQSAAVHLRAALSRVLDSPPRDRSDPELFFSESRWLERVIGALDGPA